MKLFVSHVFVYVIGIYSMETLRRFRVFFDKEHSGEYDFGDMEEFFQHDFIKYYIKRISDCVEFWAMGVKEPIKNFYIGKLEDEKLTLAREFHTYPYNVQKSGGRLCRWYLHGDDREL